MPTLTRRLLVVEDEPLMSSLLADVLRGNGFEVAVAADVLQARSAVDSFDPDAALLDISLGEGPSGVDLAHFLHRKRPDIALIFLTKHANQHAAGLADKDLPPNCGFLRKDRVRDTEYLLNSIESVLADEADRVRDDRDAEPSLSVLTAKQLEVLRLIALGYTNEYIAQITQASLSSVERWVIQVFRALEIDTKGPLNPRVEAARRYIAVSKLPERG